MATGIEWTEATWNPTTGCDRTSPGCDHCYALTLAKRLKAMGQAKYQNDGDERTSGPGFALTLHEGDRRVPATLSDLSALEAEPPGDRVVPLEVDLEAMVRSVDLVARRLPDIRR